MKSYWMHIIENKFQSFEYSVNLHAEVKNLQGCRYCKSNNVKNAFMCSFACSSKSEMMIILLD